MKSRTDILRKLYTNRFLKTLFFNPFAEYHQWRLLRFVRDAASELEAGSSIIDVGAGELKYRTEFAGCHYVSNDLCVGDDNWDYADIDIVSSAYAIPVETGKFDAILCIQVFEHLDAPEDALREFSRILRPGGRIYLSAPLLAGEHQQPYDFFRYTRYGYAKLAERHEFKIISIEPHGGAVIVLETMAWAMLWEMLPFRRQSVMRYLIYVLLYPVKLTTGVLALLIDQLDRKKAMTINYNVIFERL